MRIHVALKNSNTRILTSLIHMTWPFFDQNTSLVAEMLRENSGLLY